MNSKNISSSRLDKNPAVRFFRLSRKNRRIVTEILLTAFWIEFALRCLPFKTLTAHIKQQRVKKEAPPVERGELGRLTASVLKVFSKKQNCLRQCLILMVLFKKRGLETDLQFGVKRHQSEIEAHAWLEQNGKVLTETGEGVAAYRRLPIKGEVSV